MDARTWSRRRRHITMPAEKSKAATRSNPIVVLPVSVFIKPIADGHRAPASPDTVVMVAIPAGAASLGSMLVAIAQNTGNADMRPAAPAETSAIDIQKLPDVQVVAASPSAATQTQAAKLLRCRSPTSERRATQNMASIPIG